MDKALTTKDVKNVQILLTTTDGRYLIGTSDNPMIVMTIASFVKFVEIDADNVGTIKLEDMLKKQETSESSE